MISLISIVFVSCIYALVGWNFTKVFKIISSIEKLGLAILVGAAGSTYLWYLLSLLNIPMTLLSFFLSALLTYFLGKTLSLNCSSKLTTNNDSSIKLIDRVLIYLIMAGLLSAFIVGSYYVITAWDSLALYDFRAKAIVIDRGLSGINSSSYDLSYPLFTSLLHAVVYLLGGINPQGIYSILNTSFLAIIYGRLKDWTSTRFALIGVLLNLFTYETFMHSTIAYNNLPYVIFLVSGFLYAVSDSKKTNGIFLVLSGIMLGFSTWVRTTEYFWVLGLLLILWQTRKYKHLPTGFAGIASFTILKLGWSLYYLSRKPFFPDPPLEPHSLVSLSTLEIIRSNSSKLIEYINRYIIHPYTGPLFTTIGLLLISLRKSFYIVKLLTATILGVLVVTVGGILIYSTFFTTWYEIGDSVRRMLLFLYPLTVTTSLIAVYNLTSNEK